MSKHIAVVLLIGLCTGWVVVNWHLSQYFIQHPSVTPDKTAITRPDFRSIKNVKRRKQVFFSFFSKLIESNNKGIQQIRERILAGTLDSDELAKLAKRYRIKTDDPAEQRRQLLIKVDTIPASLVLAQAAIESAWGTSRFAVKGNNYFGQWCFKAGCGLVPQSRHDDKNHEVRVFTSPNASVDSYMRNLNSHPAYKSLRKERHQRRNNQQPVTGCLLANHLSRYSEKGQAYVETLKQMIRFNKLESDPNGFCKPKPKPKPEQEPMVDSTST